MSIPTLTAAEIAPRVRALVAQAAAPPSRTQEEAEALCPDAANLEKLGLDSWDRCEIAFALEEEFGVVFDIVEITAGWQTVGDIIAAVRKQMEAA